VSPLDILPRIADEVGDTAEIYLDGGVRSGSDVAVPSRLERARSSWPAPTSMH
jgi:hypothetical protein